MILMRVFESVSSLAGQILAFSDAVASSEPILTRLLEIGGFGNHPRISQVPDYTMKTADEPFHQLSNLSSKFSMTWRNVSYTVKSREGPGNFLKNFYPPAGANVSTEILRRVNGVVRSGTLTAIMGPSGSGKTTLLATISRRIKGDPSGEVLLNGELISAREMARISGFVPQEDLALESLSVQEHMEFMACMKMDRRIRPTMRNRRIAELLTELGLNKSSHTKLKALSGGERKKVSLAVQLLTEPILLFCDEPTTGLDSYSALAVSRTLRDVAARGKIVVCSVHQPASGLLDLFHEIVLLAAGSVAFQGTVANATLFFDGLGQVCPATYNNAEFYVSQLSVECGEDGGRYKRAKWICDEFKKSVFGEDIRDRIERSSRPTRIPESQKFFGEEASPFGEFQKANCWVQLKWLTWRSYVDHKRNYAPIMVGFIFYMLIALTVSIPFIGVTESIDQRGIQNVQGLLYLVVTETIFTFSYGVFYTFPKELPLLLRDMAGDLYHPAPYYLSKIAIMLPGAILQPFLYSILIYTITGLKGGLLGFLMFVFPVILCSVSASAYGCLMSAAFESFSTASLFAVPIDFLSIIFSGIFLHLGNLPARISWIKYLSQFYYSTEAVSLLQWGQIGHIGCSPTSEEPCISTGLGVLEKYGYNHDHYAIDMVGLFLIFLVCHLAGFLAIYLRSKKEPIY